MYIDQAPLPAYSELGKSSVLVGSVFEMKLIYIYKKKKKKVNFI